MKKQEEAERQSREEAVREMGLPEVVRWWWELGVR